MPTFKIVVVDRRDDVRCEIGGISVSDCLKDYLEWVSDPRAPIRTTFFIKTIMMIDVEFLGPPILKREENL